MADDKSLAEKLAEVNTFLDAIVENIPDMIFVKRASDLMFVRFNRAGEQLLGWDRGELLGKTDHDFYPKDQADFFHAKDREALAHSELVDIPEEPIDTRVGGRRWLHTKKVPILDEHGAPAFLLGISEDITARKLAEERAHAAERELALIGQSARDVLSAWTPEGVVVSWNPAAERMFRIPATDAIGHRLDTLLPEWLAGQFHAAQQLLASGVEIPLYEVELRTRDGREVQLEISMFSILDAQGRPTRHAAIARDTTEVTRLRHINDLLTRQSRPKLEMETTSTRMQEALAAADLVARDPVATVLLLGETGVGKGWLARRLHEQSPRSAKPFFELNCASLSATLAESELFGHERGAFTGATQQKRGIVEAAEGGTLFLDEIAELPIGVQAQLLTFLESRAFRRVGGTRTMTADVRLVAATNIDLKQALERGVFRRDLYYRLSVVPIEVPPLRERREEIPGLAKALATALATRDSGRSGKLGRPVLAALQRYDWPGNVRELRTVLERALILARGEPIELEHLAPEIRGATPGHTSQKLADVERDHILGVLSASGDNRTRAAEVLGISRSTLKRKLAEYGVHDEE
jgi:PAS domain S-box-containing protein